MDFLLGQLPYLEMSVYRYICRAYRPSRPSRPTIGSVFTPTPGYRCVDRIVLLGRKDLIAGEEWDLARTRPFHLLW